MRYSPRFLAILQALLVTFLWSTSWVVIKRYIHEIPPLTFAGLRYTLAFLVLLPALLRRREDLHKLTRQDWRQLIVLGLVLYTMTQGGQFLTLRYLDATSFSLILSFTTLLVAFFGILMLREWPTVLQWLGMIVFVIGALFYFAPTLVGSTSSGTPNQGSALGFLLAAFTVCANALAAVLGRSANRSGMHSPLVVTVLSMGVGALSLLVIGLIAQGLPPISANAWLAILWLALVNTAFAFLLWNKTLRVLSAVESSIINNTMLIQIALLAWLFLGEQTDLWGIVGLGLAACGTLLVNLKRN